MISVIIPAYNSFKTLPACLEALARQLLPPDEIIVVDDGSSDETVEIARSAGAITLLQSHQGPAAARNLGAVKAHGDLVLFTDSDCAPLPDWTTELSAPFEDPQVVGVKGAYRCKESGWVARFVQQEYSAKYARMAHQPSIDFIDTYSAAYRREVFLQNGGFDPAFPVPSVEDQEFSFRLARKGYRLVFVPQACVYHRHDRTLAEYIHRKYGIGYWKAFMLRWLPEKAFSDSHTLPALRWQILLLGLVILAGVMGIFYIPTLWLGLVGIFLFYFVDASFLVQLFRNDRILLWVAPGLILCRAAVLGWGLAAGFLSPPKTHHRSSAGLTIWQRLIKRGIDLAASLAGLILSVPILIAAAIAITLDSRGPVFFLQTRCGQNGRSFRILKLRTMVVGAEQQLSSVLDQNRLNGPAYKIPNDPRVTRIGRFLRRWSLDEVPQFWNVFKGEMSLVGPRPEETWVVAKYDDTQRQRLLVKPGLTGPMQVSGRGNLDFEARLALELDYIQSYKLSKDIRIILQTIAAVISGKGAY